MPHLQRDLVTAGRLGGLVKSSRYPPQQLTAAARLGFLARFLFQVDDASPGLPQEERQRRARALLREHMVRLGHRSAKKRRAARAHKGGQP